MNVINYFFIAIVIVLINSGSCLKCYNCLSSQSKGCLDPKSDSSLQPQECSPDLMKNLTGQVQQYAKNIGGAFGVDFDTKTNPANILMMCQKVESMVNNEKIVVRTCQLGTGSGSNELDVCKVAEKRANGLLTYCSTCTEDGCNTGNWLVPMTYSILLSAAITIVNMGSRMV